MGNELSVRDPLRGHRFSREPGTARCHRPAPRDYSSDQPVERYGAVDVLGCAGYWRPSVPADPGAWREHSLSGTFLWVTSAVTPEAECHPGGREAAPLATELSQGHTPPLTDTGLFARVNASLPGFPLWNRS